MLLFFRYVVILVLIAIAVPLLLTPLYRVVDPVSTLMLWRWATGARVERVWTPIAAMAPVVPLTVIGAEDARFCVHHGVEWGGLREAVDDLREGGDVRGHSTIAQQTAKNLFLWPGRSYVRKALELPLALWLDLVLGKRRLLEIYLNIAQWGPAGEFGIAAGARRAFGKTPRDLTVAEAALLAAMLPNPGRRDAKRPSSNLRRLAGRYQVRAKAVSRNASCLGGSAQRILQGGS